MRFNKALQFTYFPRNDTKENVILGNIYWVFTLCQSLLCCSYTGYTVFALLLILSVVCYYFLHCTDEEWEIMRDEAVGLRIQVVHPAGVLGEPATHTAIQSRAGFVTGRSETET